MVSCRFILYNLDDYRLLCVCYVCMDECPLLYQVSKMASYFDPLSSSSIGMASRMTNSKKQTTVLDLTKTVAESALQCLYSAKEGGGNPKASIFFMHHLNWGIILMLVCGSVIVSRTIVRDVLLLSSFCSR